MSKSIEYYKDFVKRFTKDNSCSTIERQAVFKFVFSYSGIKLRERESIIILLTILCLILKKLNLVKMHASFIGLIIILTRIILISKQ